MSNSRIWLSILALISGFMMVWLMISLRLLFIASFGEKSLLEMAPYAVGVGVPFFLWLHLFFRERGMPVVIGSRFGLSACAYALGAATTFLLIFLGHIEPLYMRFLSTTYLLMLIAGTILPILLWFRLFLSERKKARAARDGYG